MQTQQQLTPTLARHLYYVERWTLQDIGDRFGITRERVRQIRDKGLDKNKSRVYNRSRMKKQE